MKKMMIALIGLTIVGALNAKMSDIDMTIKMPAYGPQYGPDGVCNPECVKFTKKGPVYSHESSACKECMKKYPQALS